MGSDEHKHGHREGVFEPDPAGNLGRDTVEVIPEIRLKPGTSRRAHTKFVSQVSNLPGAQAWMRWGYYVTEGSNMLVNTTVGRMCGMDGPSHAAADRDDALSRLYRDERLGLLKLAMLLTGDHGAAEDIVHDAFLGLRRRWAELDDPQVAGGYLRTSVVNGSRSRRRRAVVAIRHLRSREPEAGPSADVAVLLAEERGAVINAVRRLPARQREVLVLRYWQGLSEAEIASTLGVAPGTVKSTASRALDAIEKLLEAHDER